jgi:hypothetical protein
MLSILVLLLYCRYINIELFVLSKSCS